MSWVKVKVNAIILVFIVVGLLTALLPSTTTSAQDNQGAFALQVTPSPIIETVKPGEYKEIEFQIRNQSSNKENLRVDLRKFEVNSENGDIELSEEVPQDVASWVRVQTPTFTVGPGAAFNEKLIANPPDSVGFSYNFAVVISRSQEPNVTTGNTKLKGSVAVFTLLSVDKPGATRKLEVKVFTSRKRLYEYLPATFVTTLTNTGNTIVQPYGNIFIQRSPTALQPITTLSLNSKGAYILPGVSRSLVVNWDQGFPRYVETKDADNASLKQQLQWDWANVQQLRIGKFYAKLVAVYNDGQRDVPIEAVVSFWVIPWKLGLVVVLLLIVLAIGIITIIRKPVKTIKNRRKKAIKTSQDKDVIDED